MDLKITGIGALVCILAVTTQVHGESKWNPSRNAFFECVQTGSPCFNSNQCCEGDVCAEHGSRKTGVCLKEKDIEFCRSDNECPDDEVCTVIEVMIGREVVTRCSKNNYRVKQQPNHSRARGEPCLDTGDCASGLCCQDVKLWRQPMKRLCEAVRRTTFCIQENSIRRR